MSKTESKKGKNIDGQNQKRKKLSQRQKQRPRKLDTKEGEQDIYKLAKTRAKKSKDIDTVKFIKGEDGKTLLGDNDIKDRWE